MEKKLNEFKMNGTWKQAMKGTEMKAMFPKVVNRSYGNTRPDLF